MTALTTPAVAGRPIPQSRRRPMWIVTDSITLAWRNMLAVVRNPQLLVVDTITPIMFVLLFAFVFGGAIKTPGIDYVTFLMPGIFVQTVVFGGTGTAIGLAEDMQKGIIDRFRSLPMAPSGVLIGRTFADLLRNAYTVAVMTLVGFLIGFRFAGSIPEFLLALGLVTLFGYAISWLSANIGLRARSAQAAQGAIFIPVFPLTFASSAFVPVATMPDWLRPIAEANPVTIVVNAARGLILGTPDTVDRAPGVRLDRRPGRGFRSARHPDVPPPGVVGRGPARPRGRTYTRGSGRTEWARCGSGSATGSRAGAADGDRADSTEEQLPRQHSAFSGSRSWRSGVPCRLASPWACHPSWSGSSRSSGRSPVSAPSPSPETRCGPGSSDVAAPRPPRATAASTASGSGMAWSAGGSCRRSCSRRRWEPRSPWRSGHRAGG